MKRFDCFGIGGSDNRARCLIIDRSDCTGCPFYKTAQQFEHDSEQARLTLFRRGREPCIRTIKKWYGGAKFTYTQIMSTRKRESK